MSEETNPFRDEAMMNASASQKRPAAIDPFLSPAVSSAPHAVDSADGGSAPRISPMWAFLIGQTPYHLAFWSMVLTAGSELERPLSALFHAATFDAVAYSGRTFSLGPGKASLRAPVALACMASTAMLPGWFAVATGTEYRGAGLSVTLEFSVLTISQSIAALGAAAIFFACGSRDVSRAGGRSSIGWGDNSAAIFAAVSFAFAAAPFVAVVARDLPGQLEWLMRRRFVDHALEAMIGVAFTTCLSVNWRMGLRGIDRFASWKTLVFALVAIPFVGFVSLISFGTLMHDELRQGVERLVPLAPLAALVVVPIAREVFLRWAGYRAINVYVERRRRRKQAIPAASGSV